MPEKSGTEAPFEAANAGAAATAASAAAMHGICLSFIAAPHHVRKTMLHRSGRAFTGKVLSFNQGPARSGMTRELASVAGVAGTTPEKSAGATAPHERSTFRIS